MYTTPGDVQVVWLTMQPVMCLSCTLSRFDVKSNCNVVIHHFSLPDMNAVMTAFVYIGTATYVIAELIFNYLYRDSVVLLLLLSQALKSLSAP